MESADLLKPGWTWSRGSLPRSPREHADLEPSCPEDLFSGVTSASLNPCSTEPRAAGGAPGLCSRFLPPQKRCARRPVVALWSITTCPGSLDHLHCRPRVVKSASLLVPQLDCGEDKRPGLLHST